MWGMATCKEDGSRLIEPHPNTVIQTRFLRLRRPVPLGHSIDGWRVCWIGGWDRGHVFFVVMVKRVSSKMLSRFF
jgi:hypothetical protein